MKSPDKSGKGTSLGKIKSIRLFLLPLLVEVLFVDVEGCGHWAQSLLSLQRLVLCAKSLMCI